METAAARAVAALPVRIEMQAPVPVYRRPSVWTRRKRTRCWNSRATMSAWPRTLLRQRLVQALYVVRVVAARTAYWYRLHRDIQRKFTTPDCHDRSLWIALEWLAVAASANSSTPSIARRKPSNKSSIACRANNRTERLTPVHSVVRAWLRCATMARWCDSTVQISLVLVSVAIYHLRWSTMALPSAQQRVQVLRLLPNKMRWQKVLPGRLHRL